MTNVVQVIHHVAVSGGGDWASIAGVLIALVGFVVTLIKVHGSQKAVARVRGDLLRRNSVIDFSSAITTMEEIRRLHRQKAWPILPDRYSALRKALISIRTTDPDLSDEQKTVLQNALTHFCAIEKQVEKALNGESEINVVRINSIASRQIDALNELLVKMNSQTGR